MTLFVALAGTVSAETVMFTASSDKGTTTNQAQGADAITKSGITISSTKCAFGNGSEYRIYGSNTFTVSSEVGNITSVVITSTAASGNNSLSKFAALDGFTIDGKVGTWTGEAASITWTASAQVRVVSVEVTYTPSSTGGKTYPNLSFDPTTVSLTLGETFTAPTLNNEHNVTVTYESSDPDVASVVASTGAVTILAAGTATITASSEEDDTYHAGEASYVLTVNKINPALAFSESSVQLNLGDVFTAPTLTNALNMAVTYESSNTDVATVDGATGAVTIVGTGSATITASSEEDATHSAGSASYSITVLAADAHVYWSEDWTGAATGASPTDVNAAYTFENGGGTTKIYNETLAGGSAPELLIAKTSGSLTYGAINVEGQTGTLTFSYKSNRPSLVVTSSTTGVEISEATNSGSTYTYTITLPDATTSLSLTITASVNSRIDDIMLTGDYSATTLLDAELEFSEATATVTLGQTFTAPTLSNPNGLTVTYSSSNDAIATVDPQTGEVTPVGVGTATITASSEATDVYRAGSASYELTVESAVPTTSATFWSEDWTGAVADQTPSDVNSAYTYEDGGTTTKIYEQTYASGESPELLVAKTGGSLTYDAINIAGHTGTLTLTYGANNDNLVLTSDTEGVTVSKESYENKVATWTISVPTTTSTLNLTLSNSKSNNTRLDNILLTGTVYDLGTGSFTITAAGYGTYYTDQAFIMPTGVQGGVITAVATPNSNGIAKATTNWKYKAGSVVPANEALLIKGAANTYDYTITESNASATADNLLKGSTVAVTPTSAVPSYYYMLSYGKNENANVLGFYYGNSDGSAFLSGANKCWIELPQSGSSVRGLIFDFNDDVTGINSIDAAEGVKAVYDLQGRRVVAPKAGNIYIVNGKKVLVK